MTDPGLITNAIVAKLQAIAELVTLLGGTNHVFPYRREFPEAKTLPDAIYRMPIPSVMVVWEGTGPGNLSRIGEVWKHRFGLYVRFKEENRADAAAGAYKLWDKIINGVPANGDGLKFLRCSIHPNCFPMDPPSISPQTLSTETSGGPFEFWKVSLALTEIGDN